MYQEEIKQLLQQVVWIDDLTYYHSLRVGNLMSQFLETKDGQNFLKQAWVTRNEAVVAALLHDIGKSTWPPELLLSSLRLKDMPRDQLRKMWSIIIDHPLSSEEIIMQYYEKTGNRFWQRIAQGVVAHHENFGGGGYPFNLSGQEIPLLARGLRVLDKFSLLTYVRRYRSVKLHRDKAIEEMRSQLGQRYDPYWGNIILDFLQCAKEEKELDTWLEAEIKKF